MKPTTRIATLLTILSFWLVAVAAILFLLQARSRQETRLADAATTRQVLDASLLEAGTREAEMVQRNDALAGAMATTGADLSAANNALATAAANAAAADAAATQTAAELADALSAANELAAARERELAQPPAVRVVAPADGTIIAPGDSVVFIVTASDPSGVTSVFISVDGETIVTYEANDETVVTLNERWTTEDEGSYTVGIMAVDSGGRASEPVELTIDVVDIGRVNAEVRQAIEDRVVEIRGLAPLTDVVPTTLTADELRLRVEEDFFADVTPEESAEDVVVYAAFDYLPRDFDLYSFYLDFYSAVIAGFYDPETDEMVVISDGSLLSPLEQITYAHEYMHALQDQYYNLESYDANLDSEAQFAARALVEGEADFLEGLYVGTLSRDELTALAAEFQSNPNAEAAAAIEAAPPIIVAQTVFPYVAGGAFVEFLYDEGGFEAVDEAWANLPRTTEQILHPELYLAGELPIAVSLPPLTATLGAGWNQLDSDMLGEFFLREYLAQAMLETEAADAAAGWNGDRYAVFYNADEDALVMALRVAWDTPADQEAFSLAYVNYMAAQFGTPAASTDPGVTCAVGTVDLVCLTTMAGPGDRVDTLIVRAPRPAMAFALLDEIRGIQP